jgi:hypothetical protein
MEYMEATEVTTAAEVTPITSEHTAINKETRGNQ